MAYEAIVVNMWRFLFMIIPWLKHPLSPKRIVRATAKEARRQARSWGMDNKREIPNRYVVYVPAEDWDSYYRSRAGTIGNRIGTLLLRRFADSDYVMVGKPEVELFLDDSPEWRPIRVEASFGRLATAEGVVVGKAPAAIERPGDGACGMGGRHTAPIDNTVGPSGDNGRGEQSRRGACKTLCLANVAKTPVMRSEALSAVLVNDYAKHCVKDGFKVGANRGDAAAATEIALTGPGCEFVSREHGVFYRRGREWGYSNLGANGTKIEHADGRTEHLERGDACPLRDGDLLHFASDVEYRFLECSAR